MTPIEKLKDVIIKNSYKYNEETPFKLASGAISPFYFDLKMTLLNPEGLKLIGEIIYDKISGINADAIGGLTLGADPIALSASITAFTSGRVLYPLIVRKEPKGHGTKKYIEGYAETVKSVIAVDDVITTGGSTITAINRFREAGIKVDYAVVIVDREENDGVANIEKEGVKVISVFKKSEFKK